MMFNYKKMIIIFLITISILFIYLKNDGLYIINNINMTEIELINKYTLFKFPEETIIENFILEDDIKSCFISHNEYIRATLLIPSKMLDNIFPLEFREYNRDNILDLRKEETNENVDYGIWIPITVGKWFDKTQRNINFTVMKSNDSFTRVYVYVDKLGWNIIT